MKRIKFKGSQRFRVVANGISFYVDAQSVRDGVGDFTSLNGAVRQAMEELELHRADGMGLGGSWNGYQIQLCMV